MMQALFLAPWAVFGAWWIVRAFSTARTERVEPPRQRATFLVLVAAATLFMVVTPEPLRRRLWPSPLPLVLVGLVLDVAGVTFAIVAREFLGRMWSGRVTLKEDHVLVQRGPYRVVRHPIYTGILTALVGVVLARGDLAGVVAFVMYALGIARKMVSEEEMLRAHFGAAYDDYRKKVAAIIPFIL
jgi:protein-S-isoprenylcysteine O-methyltransferase Ste14